jgi:hypothetical protein
MFEGGCQATVYQKWPFYFLVVLLNHVFHLKSFCFFIIMALAVQPLSSLLSAVPAVSTPSSSIRNSRPMTAVHSNRTIDTKFVVDWNNPSAKTKTTNENLQEAFRQFREQRIVS